jgi:sulfur carrier protein ThiS
MIVTVKLFNQLRSYAPSGERIVRQPLPTGASVNDLLKQLNIPATVQRTILVNGRRVDDGAALSADDEVVLMSPIEGG